MKKHLTTFFSQTKPHSTTFFSVFNFKLYSHLQIILPPSWHKFSLKLALSWCLFRAKDCFSLWLSDIRYNSEYRKQRGCYLKLRVAVSHQIYLLENSLLSYSLEIQGRGIKQTSFQSRYSKFDRGRFSSKKNRKQKLTLCFSLFIVKSIWIIWEMVYIYYRIIGLFAISPRKTHLRRMQSPVRLVYFVRRFGAPACPTAFLYLVQWTVACIIDFDFARFLMNITQM